METRVNNITIKEILRYMVIVINMIHSNFVENSKTKTWNDVTGELMTFGKMPNYKSFACCKKRITSLTKIGVILYNYVCLNRNENINQPITKIFNDDNKIGIYATDLYELIKLHDETESNGKIYKVSFCHYGLQTHFESEEARKDFMKYGNIGMSVLLCSILSYIYISFDIFHLYILIKNRWN